MDLIVTRGVLLLRALTRGSQFFLGGILFCFFFASLAWAGSLADQVVFAERAELPNGVNTRTLECRILEEKENSLIIQFEWGRGILNTVEIQKSDLSHFEYGSEDQLDAFLKIKDVLVLPPASREPLYYQKMIDQYLQPFVTKFPSGKQSAVVQKWMDKFHSEIEEIGKGGVRLEKKWYYGWEAELFRVDAESLNFLKKVEDLGNRNAFPEMLEALEEIQTLKASRFFPEVVKMAAEQLEKLKPYPSDERIQREWLKRLREMKWTELSQIRKDFEAAANLLEGSEKVVSGLEALEAARQRWPEANYYAYVLQRNITRLIDETKAHIEKHQFLVAESKIESAQELLGLFSKANKGDENRFRQELNSLLSMVAEATLYQVNSLVVQKRFRPAYEALLKAKAQASTQESKNRDRFYNLLYPIAIKLFKECRSDGNHEVAPLAIKLAVEMSPDNPMTVQLLQEVLIEAKGWVSKENYEKAEETLAQIEPGITDETLRRSYHLELSSMALDKAWGYLRTLKLLPCYDAYFATRRFDRENPGLWPFVLAVVGSVLTLLVMIGLFIYGATKGVFAAVFRRAKKMMGRYVVKERLGEGGTGEVFLAYDKQLKRTVAIKRLNVSATFEREIRKESEILAMMQHPNIVTIYDLYRDEDDIPFVVMEYVQGKTLFEIIRKQGPLSIDMFLKVMSQVCLGLGAAHSRDIIHRDLKMPNIMVHYHDRDTFTVKLVDFGLARPVWEGEKVVIGEDGQEQIMGSLSVVAPEQLRREQVTHLTDIYSLGCVCYASLVGMDPFDGSTEEIIQGHLEETPCPVRVWREEVPEQISQTIARMLAKDPAQRPSSAEEVRKAFLDSVLDEGSARIRSQI